MSAKLGPKHCSRITLCVTVVAPVSQQALRESRRVREDAMRTIEQPTATSTPKPRRARSITRFALAMLLAATLSVGATLADPTPKAASANPVASWFVQYLLKKMSTTAAKEVLKSMGYTCAIDIWSCTTSYDPPKWFYYGVVQTGNGSAGYLRARGWASNASNVPVIRTFPENWKLVIFCQTTGDWVYGRWGWTNIWNYVGRYGEAGMFVSDGFVYTASNDRVAGDCDNTNMGDG